MSGAPFPTFADGEFPFAEPPPSCCYWCRGPNSFRWSPSEHAINGIDFRNCTSINSHGLHMLMCHNIPADLAAVILDRIAETPRRYARVRVLVEHIDRDEYDDETWQANHWNKGKWSPYDVPGDMRLTAICHAEPTWSQHLAECLMHDPEIDHLLRAIREKHAVAVEAVPRWELRGNGFDWLNRPEDEGVWIDRDQQTIARAAPHLTYTEPRT